MIQKLITVMSMPMFHIDNVQEKLEVRNLTASFLR